MQHTNRFQGLGCGCGHYSVSPAPRCKSTRIPQESQLIPDQPRALWISVAERQRLCKGVSPARQDLLHHFLWAVPPAPSRWFLSVTTR